MQTTKYLIIGGGLAANSAIRTLRKRDNESSLTLVTDESHVPYNRPPLSKEFLRGTLSKERLFFDSELYYEEQNIQTFLDTGRFNRGVSTVYAMSWSVPKS